MEWKRILEADEPYFISDQGEVEHNGRILKPRSTKTGYLRVQFKHNGKYVDFYIHRLVAKYFIPNPNNYNCVNHIDGNKSHNYKGNLEWCTYKMNMTHASTHGLINTDSKIRKETCKKNQLKSVENNSKPMIEYDEKGHYVQEHLSGTNALYRLSYKGHYYRDKAILQNQYGYVPKEIPIKYILLARSHNRRTFLGEKDGVATEFSKLSELPSTREQFYFAYNHLIPDVNGYTWQILVHI